MQHRPQPDEGDQPPAHASVASRAQPGADDDSDQEIADHLGAHRQPVLHREERGRGRGRRDQRLGAVAAHDVERQEERDLEQPGQPGDAGQPEPVLGPGHHDLGQPLRRHPVAGGERAHAARVAERPSAEELLAEAEVEVGVGVGQGARAVGDQRHQGAGDDQHGQHGPGPGETNGRGDLGGHHPRRHGCSLRRGSRRPFRVAGGHEVDQLLDPAEQRGLAVGVRPHPRQDLSPGARQVGLVGVRPAQRLADARASTPWCAGCRARP